MNAFCRGCGLCSVPKPSSVMIGSSPTSRKAIEQVLVSFPPTDAAQAPHCPRPQPNFGPFNPRSFRSTYNSGVSAAAVTTWDPPFTVSRYVILHPRSWRQSGGRAPSRLAQRYRRNSELPCLRRRPDLCLFDVTKLSHAWISDRAPSVDRFRCHWECARIARIHLGELFHAEAVLERHAVGFQEVKEHAGGGWMPARPEHDRHIVFLHAVLRFSDIVDLGNHEVQVMKDPPRTLAYSDAVMERTGKRPHEGHYLSDAVGFPKVQHVTEVLDRFGLLRHRPYDVAETLDLGVGGRERLART